MKAVFIPATQISFSDYMQAHKEVVIDQWARWRDAQSFDDVNKQLVDEVYGEYIRTLDKVIDLMVPF